MQNLNLSLLLVLHFSEAPNGLRYLRWGGDGEAVQLEKGSGVGKGLRLPQTPLRQVHALLASLLIPKACFP